LQGVKTKKGAYFDIFNLEKKKKGIAQIDRVGDRKAIVNLKTGSISKRWMLQPVSKELALYEIEKSQKRKALMTRIHKEQIKRKIAFKKKQLDREKKKRVALKNKLKRERQIKLARRRALIQKNLLAKKKREIKRKLASYSLDENILEDLGEEIEQSSEVLSYNLPSSDKENDPSLIKDNMEPSEENRETNVGIELVEIKEDKTSRFKLGLIPFVTYDFMRISPLSQSNYSMSGLGFGTMFSTDFVLNRFVSAGASIGGKRFFASAREDECGQTRGCSLLIYYASAGLHLKLNLIEFYGHKLWLKGEGTLLQPISYSNEVPNLTKESFSPFHGTLGGGLGLDLNFKQFTLPFVVDFNIHMPPTQTILTGSFGAQFGLFYNF
ncbi:MAG: hypothetical protein OXC37_00060, partial [Bdellovibrionaceae bacterium]|nr:hypothetical protein [Pseudobdellovibrionaceae bacterium]